MIKKLSLVGVTLGLVSLAQAGAYTAPNCSPSSVTAPCESTAWDVGFEAFIARAGNGNQGYVYTDSTSATQVTQVLGNEVIETYIPVLGDTAGHEEHIGSDEGFGFILDASYHFRTGNDLIVSWEHFVHTDNASVALPVTDSTTFHAHMPVIGFMNESTVDGNAPFTLGNVIIAGLINPTDPTVLSIKADGALSYELNRVDVEVGQTINLSPRYDLRLHGGLEYADLELSKKIRFVSSSISFADEVIVNTFNAEQRSDFEGLGVRVGADMMLKVCDSVSLVGRGSAALLFGEVESQLNINNRNVNQSFAPGTIENNIVYRSEKESIIVPAAMGKVGLMYDTELLGGHLALEGGWRTEGFYHAVQMDLAAQLNNVTLSGPYAAVKYIS